VLPVPLIRNGRYPAAMSISSGTVEQKYPATFPPGTTRLAGEG
jgi:hypothetical protein